MGLISIVKQFARAVVDGAYKVGITHDPGSGDSNDAEVYGPSGDDSPPLPEDFAILVDTPGSGRQNVVGYMDTRNEGVAEKGEVRRYARDQNGAIVSVVWLKGDGTVIVESVVGDSVVQIDRDGQIHLGDAPAAAKLTRDDRVTVELERIYDAVINWVPSIAPMDGGAAAAASLILAFTNAKAAMQPTACEKVSGT